MRARPDQAGRIGRQLNRLIAADEMGELFKACCLYSPGWTPPAAMKRRQPNLPDHMPGGINNPLGARAIYIGSTLYRIHGTNEPWTIGGDVSSGCIRMVNDDVIDLYDRVKIGAKVIVL